MLNIKSLESETTSKWVLDFYDVLTKKVVLAGTMWCHMSVSHQHCCAYCQSHSGRDTSGHVCGYKCEC